jgi:hypothetical protein
MLNSISRLERLQQWLEGVVIVGGLVALLWDGIGGLVGVVAGVGLWLISRRLSVLRSNRTFTPEQKQAILDNLQGKSSAPFFLRAYAPSSDCVQYASQLEKILTDAGWQYGSSECFTVSGGDMPPTGITIKVDGKSAEAAASGRQLELALKAAQVEDVTFVEDEECFDLPASRWVLIKLGPRGSQ